MKQLVLRAVLFLCSAALAIDARTIPDEPVSTFAWTNATSAAAYQQFVIATTNEGVVTFWSGIQQSQLTLPSSPMQIRMFGNMMLVLTRSQELFLITINDAGTLVLLNRFDPGGEILDYAFDNQSIFIARGFGGVHRYSYHWQGPFQWTDSSMTPIHCTDLAYQYPLLLVVDDYDGVYIYDITNGNLDNLVDTQLVRFQINDIAISGRYVAATSEDHVMLGGVLNLATRQFVRFDSLTQVESQQVFFHDSNAFAIADDHVRLTRWLGHPTLKFTNRLTLTKPIRPSVGMGKLSNSIQYPGSIFAAAGDGTILYFGAGSSQGIINPVQYTFETGPYSGIKMIDSTVYVGGPNFPLRSYKVSEIGGVELPEYTIPGLLNARDFDVRNDTLLVLSPLDRAVMIYSLADPNDPQLIRSIPVDTTLITEARFVDWPTDTMAVIAMSGINTVLLYTIRDTLPTENPSRIFMLGRIIDYSFVDSMMVILSNKRVMDVYRLHDDLSSSFRGSASTAGQASKFFTIKRPGLIGDTVNGMFLIAGEVFSHVDLSVPSAPRFDMSTNVGVSISDVSVFSDTLYAIGPSGMARLVFENNLPVVREIGGRSGNSLSRSGKFIATSSGESVFLYELIDEVFTDVDDEPENLPSVESILSQNWPNPFNPQTTIPYSLPLTGSVRLTVFNILGQEVTTLVDQTQAAGNYTVQWNGRDQTGMPVASGLYLYRLELPDRAESRKMMLVR